MAMLMNEEAGRGFTLLDEGECFWLLERQALGRVAVSVGALPAVFPVNYAMADGNIYFLTGEGTKLSHAVRGAAVAFEIDEFDVQYHQGWSVFAVGLAHEVDETETAMLLDQLHLEPRAPGAREHLVCIRPDFLSGRRIGFAAL